MGHWRTYFLAALIAAAGLPAAAGPGDVVEQARDAGRAHWRGAERAILAELIELLAIPNVAADRENIERNAAHLVAMLEKRGAEARILDTGSGSPAVFGALDVPGATATVLFYSHYDGQPVALDAWASPPWQPTLRDGRPEDGGKIIDLGRIAGPVNPDYRLFARSSSDDKMPIVALLAAIDALGAAGLAPSVNVHFFFDGEEESGSPHLPQMLEAHKNLLKADLWIFADGPVHQTGHKKISFGVRGAVGWDLTTYGPARPLHSGHYGNFAPNPTMMLAHLLTSMRNPDGRVLIEGYYDSVVPPSAAEMEAIANLPDIDARLKRDLALGRIESPDWSYQESILWPALNARGIHAGQILDQARNIIVTTATASMGYRLVPNQMPDDLRRLTIAHLERQGYHVVFEDPDEEVRRGHPRVVKLGWSDRGTPGLRTDMDAPYSRALISIMTRLYPDVMLVPGSGGTLPIWEIQGVLGVPLIMLPTVNADNNQHAENENIRIGNIPDAIEIFAAVLAGFGPAYEAAQTAP